MFKNYLKIAYRNIMKQKVYSVINIFGLSLGLTACILVGLYIWQDLHYDDFHANKKNIYRISVLTEAPQGSPHTAETPALVAPNIQHKYPEIKEIARVYFPSRNLISNDERKFYEKDVIFADDGFFQIFSYDFIQGNPQTCLQEKNSIIITRSIAEKYFGAKNPIGESLKLDNKIDLKVAAVIEDAPVNSHFTFDFVATYSTVVDMPEGMYLDQWGATFGSYTYLMLQPGADPVAFGEKISPFLNKTMRVLDGVMKYFILQSVESIHLRSDFEDEIMSNSSITYLLILGSVALFILILACINFINLTTARAVKRAREIGVRKVFGAAKQQLIRQFIGESILVTLIALCLSFVLVEVLEPAFNRLIGTELIYNCFEDISILATIVAATFIFGILAGLYPAFVLTHFQPVNVMKGSLQRGKSGSSLLRKTLVLLQFSISLVLIIFTILINQQIGFMRSFDMGFDQEEVIILKTPERMSYNSETIKTELNAIPGVKNAAASLGVPIVGSGFGTNLIPDMSHEDESFIVSVRMIDHDFTKFYDIPLLVGRNLSEMKGADFSAITMVNESTVKKLGFASPEDALGNKYTIGLSDGVQRFSPEIVGVVKDFHFNSLHEEVSPLLFMHWPYLFQELSIKISPNDVPRTISAIKDVWQKFYPEHPFDYSFMNDKINMIYKAEERSFKVISTFSILAIMIACMGLLGLTFYTTEQRKKEIGIRKILGATIPNIVKNISMEFMKLVMISNLVAWPVSYILVNKWLANFPYKVNVSLSVFIIAGGIALLISFITIGYTVFRSSYSNPIESIRYE